ncbi:hypothetical protein [Rhodoferax antarcticus]|uniref:Uncharacterized protein n=1 Tax=Rhodoferax antarcticus ANT.BR TaxID=1111071 RepID=A0A1Q8Y9U3_9BURK|nr:hypothetical protein [Rhodoferax antarcticus]OLP04650.1 hypothetical protein BLL52_4174 [Rhodoferax antarcticus ANT.BR]
MLTIKRDFYILPAKVCVDALVRFNIAKDDASSATTDLKDEYGCDGVICSGSIGVGLAYRFAARINGFGPPTRINSSHWMIKPDRKTNAGMVAQNKLDDVADLLTLLTWSLEKCLGVFGMVADGDATHFVVAKPLNDGRVMLSVPQGDWLSRDPLGCILDLPVIPADSELVDEARAKRLINEAMTQAKEPS